MKERYEDIACDVVEFEMSDVIITSGDSNNPAEGEGGIQS